MRAKPIFKLTAIALGVGLAQHAAAQVLEEVVVTATKRAESMQDVPISMIAMSGETIRDMGITKAEDFTADMPAISINQSPVGNTLFIRGIGTPGNNQGIEQSVTIFHDGVYMGRHQMSRAPFMDLERVEVLRGPQSVLFGKNTIGGAIHVISAKPTDELEGMASGLYNWDDGEQEINGVISGPITDTLRGRLAYRSYDLDGYLENVMTGDDAPERDDTTVRGQLAWDATQNLTITARWENSQFEQTQTSSQLSIIDPFTDSSAATTALNSALVATATGGRGIEKYDDERAVINDGGVLLGQVVPGFAGLPGFPDLEEGSDNESDLGILTLDWAIGDHTLTSITGYAQYDYRDICDCDFAAIPLIQANATEDYDQWSQEIRITSPGGEKIDYIAGFYYHESDLEFRSVEAFGTALLAPEPGNLAVPNLTRDYTMKQDQDMWAIFGSLTYSFTDSTRATFGLRYFEESKEADHRLDKKFTAGWDYSALAGLPVGTLAYGDTAAEYDRFEDELGGGPLGILVDTANGIYFRNLGTSEHDIQGRKRDEDEWTWAVTLEHDLNDETMLFATASTGSKGGGFDARFLGVNNGPFFEYEDESAMNYEIGSKSTLLEGAMTLNATAFFTTVEDYQVSVFDGATAFFVQNAAEVESKGVEVDLNWAATDQLVVSAAVSYLDAAYSDFPNAPCWAGTDENNRGKCVGRGTPTAHRDASGDTNVFSPDWAFNLNFDYRQPVGDSLEARAILNVNYSDEYANGSDLDPVYAYQDSFTKYDVRLSLGSYDGTWEVAVIGRNLGDELTSGNNNDQPLAPGNGFSLTDRTRSYAVQATYRF